MHIKKLSEILGVPVVRTIAVHNSGTHRVIARCPSPGRRAWTTSWTRALRDTYERNNARLTRANEILAPRPTRWMQPKEPPFSLRLGFWSMHPVKGLVVLAAMLAFVFWFVGLFGAGTLVDLLEVNVFEQRLSPLADPRRGRGVALSPHPRRRGGDRHPGHPAHAGARDPAGHLVP